MGLFTPKPYKMNNLSAAEKAAVGTALEIGIQCSSGSLVGTLKTARRNFNNGALSQTDMAAVLACLNATLTALSSGDDSDMRTTLLKQKAVIQVSIVLAIEKLKAMAGIS